MNTHVLGFVKTCAEIKIGEIDCDGFGAFSGEDAIHHDLECRQVGCADAGGTVVVQEVASDGEPYAMRFFFVRTESGDDT